MGTWLLFRDGREKYTNVCFKFVFQVWESLLEETQRPGLFFTFRETFFPKVTSPDTVRWSSSNMSGMLSNLHRNSWTCGTNNKLRLIGFNSPIPRNGLVPLISVFMLQQKRKQRLPDLNSTLKYTLNCCGFLWRSTIFSVSNQKIKFYIYSWWSTEAESRLDCNI